MASVVLINYDTKYNFYIKKPKMVGIEITDTRFIYIFCLLSTSINVDS